MCSLSGLMLLSSCGQQHQAESLAEDYLEQNARQPDSIRQRIFLSLDSTRLISDSTIKALRAYNHPRMKQTGEADAPAQAGRILYVLPMKYLYGNSTEQERLTFYLDEQMLHIVAVK